MSVTYPNGRNQDLLHIADWDPSWQNTYSFEQPIRLPKGSVVKIVAHYDNSPHAPTPTDRPNSSSMAPT